MPIEFRCPQCGQLMRTPDDSAGKQAKCPQCMVIVSIPKVDEIARTVTPLPEPPAHEPASAAGDSPTIPDASSRMSEVPPLPGQPSASTTNPYIARVSAQPVAVGNDTPGKVMAVRIMLIVGGAFALLTAFGMVLLSAGLLLLWPGTILAIVSGICSLIHGVNMNRQRIPTWVPILQIICVINCDAINLIVGIIELVFLREREVQIYLTD